MVNSYIMNALTRPYFFVGADDTGEASLDSQENKKLISDFQEVEC